MFQSSPQGVRLGALYPLVGTGSVKGKGRGSPRKSGSDGLLRFSRSRMLGSKNISQLKESMLLPQLELVKEAIDSGDREMFLDRYNVMIQTCNQCHTASDYGAVKVLVPETNPFNQNFSAD